MGKGGPATGGRGERDERVVDEPFGMGRNVTRWIVRGLDECWEPDSDGGRSWTWSHARQGCYEFERDLILNEVEYLDHLKAFEKRSKKVCGAEICVSVVCFVMTHIVLRIFDAVRLA